VRSRSSSTRARPATRPLPPTLVGLRLSKTRARAATLVW
jgi:hypothetical protein